uniref:MATH domain-containing protein n=1 Tax=Oryza punctata TaxID=4537 RepID=A0A0E0LEH1_ORYPU
MSSMNLTEAKSVEYDFKVNGYSATKAGSDGEYPSKRVTVGGYQWEISYTPNCFEQREYWVAIKLVFLGPTTARPAGGSGGGVKASLKCLLVDAQSSWKRAAQWRDASGEYLTCQEKCLPHLFTS